MNDADDDEKLKFAAIYGNGAVMGFSPRQVDDMSLWEFVACLDGWKTAQGVEDKPEPPTPDEYHDMVSRLA